MLLNSHAICNAHEAVARVLVEEVLGASLDNYRVVPREAIDQADALARAAGFDNVVLDIHMLGEEYS